MKEARLFTTASMMIVMTSSAVITISMKNPCAGLVGAAREFAACSLPGNMADTINAATMPPANCTGMTQISLIQLKAPANQSPRATYQAVRY